MTRGTDDLLLGEWACLGALCSAPAHGFAVAARLRSSGDIGRVWSLSRPLTYRALDQLVARDLARQVGEEPGIAGGNRTILGPTRAGRARLRSWLATPVEHLRDVRSELLLKLVIADACSIDTSALVAAQRARVVPLVGALREQAATDDDMVTLWRSESSEATLRFLDRLHPLGAATTVTR